MNIQINKTISKKIVITGLAVEAMLNLDGRLTIEFVSYSKTKPNWSGRKVHHLHYPTSGEPLLEWQREYLNTGKVPEILKTMVYSHE